MMQVGRGAMSGHGQPSAIWRREMHKFTRFVFVIGLSVVSANRPALATSGTPTWSLSLVATPTGTQYVSTPDLAFDHYGIPSTSYSLVDNTVGSNSVRHAQLTSLGLWSSRELANG